MRTRIMFAALSIATISAGCGTLEVFDGVSVRCRDRDITVVNNPGRLSVNKESVEVCRGYSVALRFRNTVPNGMARTMQSGAGQEWLNVPNTATGIVIMVPPDATPMELKYTLEVDGLGLLDPRIVIQ